jgi:hypothetical protein
MDKHRLLIVVAVAAKMGQQIRLDSKVPCLLTHMLPKRSQISEEANEVFRFVFAERNPTFEAYADIACQVAFKKAGLVELAPVTEILVGLIQVTAELVGKFSKEF